MKKVKAPKRIKGWGQVQIGTSSLVLIFTVLSLVIFSTLSISSAKVDQNLAEKTKVHITEYYTADGFAETKLMEINENLNYLEKAINNQIEYEKAISSEYMDGYNKETKIINFTIDINNDQELLVSLILKDYEIAKLDNRNYEIQTWKVINKMDYKIDDSLTVWDGNSIE